MDHRAVRSRAKGLIAALAGLALAVPAPVLAWGGYGHRTTAEIAEANVRPETRAAMNRLFAYEDRLGTPDCRMRDLPDASTWPDCIRRDGWRWGYTGAWHYRTAPICEPYNERANCPGGNCVTAQIDRAQRLLADESMPGHIRLEALSFLVHFVGDVHMPLHSGDREDRGGNDRETDYGIVPDLNLHWIWDGPLAERAISSAEPPLVRRYSDEERAAIATGGPHDWGRESWQIAREVAYATAFDRDPCAGELPGETALSQEDIEVAIPVANQRVLQAGLRIARLLDEAFAPDPLPVPERERR